MLGLVALGGVSHAEDTPKQRASAVLDAAARGGFSGTVCVESGGATLVDSALGWADDRHSRRVDPDTLYHVASVTKLVTAIAALKLAEQGTLALADPLGKWFPEAPPDKAAITIEQLLLHQSGLGQNYAADGIASRDAAVRAVLATALSFPPGTAQKYSNDGMNLVAAVIEKASGRSYRDLVHDEILAPAGLKRSLLWEEVNLRKTQNLAVPAAGAAAGPAAGRNWGLTGGDGLWSNARELTRLMRAVVGGRILRSESEGTLGTSRQSPGAGAAPRRALSAGRLRPRSAPGPRSCRRSRTSWTAPAGAGATPGAPPAGSRRAPGRAARHGRRGRSSPRAAWPG